MKKSALVFIIFMSYAQAQATLMESFEASIKTRTKELEQIAVVLNELTNQTPNLGPQGEKLRCLKNKGTMKLWRWDVEASLERERFYPFATKIDNQICVNEEGYQNIIIGSQHKIAELKELQKFPQDLSKKSKKELRDQIASLKTQIEQTEGQIGHEVSQENRRSLLVVSLAVAAMIITVIYMGIPLLTYVVLFTILVSALKIGTALKGDYNSYVAQKTNLKKELLIYSQKALAEFDKVSLPPEKQRLP